ncbi:hypothetical protein POM88_026943 [Heracleum sosnowskyi]|uniref:ELP1 first N-terminal beta-propeller domain-containing protein n=1 Tax=Heracleum sosnowskyi TaxID=360622 RepID=A0AAD8I6T7_9APIA|nr:hypothetical protein POM88_026943 [Heracleum sosnowskyi]
MWQDGGRIKTSLPVVVEQIDLEHGDFITSMDFVMEKEALVAGTSNGHLLLYNVDDNATETVGRVEGGVKCISPSPDGDLLAVVTGFGQILVMTHDWDLLYETSIEEPTEEIDVKGSSTAFDDILVKDIVSWNTILLAYGMNGWASKALQVQEETVASGVYPDKVSFTGLLMTCSHSGLIDKGRALLKSMSDYGLSPDVDHVTCVVDMLGRAGYLKEAREVANLYLGKDSMTISSD